MKLPSRRPRVSGDPVSQRPQFGAPLLPLLRARGGPIRVDPGDWDYWMPAGAGMTAVQFPACPTLMLEVIE
jgi:hypothetical protein